MMKEKMIKLWMVAMGLLLSVQAFSYGEDRPYDIYEDYNPNVYDPRHPIEYSLMDPRHWFQYVGDNCRRQVRVIDPFVVCAYGHYWQEDTKTCNNFAGLLYVTPEYIDSVTKKTGGILTFPDTIHIGPPDSVGLSMIPRKVEGGGIIPWPTDVKIGNVYWFDTRECYSELYLTRIRRFYGIENLQKDTANVGKIKYYRVNRSVYDEKCKKQYEDTLLTGCYTQLPMMAFDVKEGITSITAYTFWNCPNLMKVNMPQSLVKIERSAFEGCTQLDNVTLPDSVRIIGASAFKGCTQLQNIALSPTVFSMEGYAFEGCVRLKNITLPDSLRDIGVYAFKGCI